jgi:hypothetical protein
MYGRFGETYSFNILGINKKLKYIKKCILGAIVPG